MHVVGFEGNVLFPRSMRGIQLSLNPKKVNWSAYPYLLSDLLAEDALVFEVDRFVLDFGFFLFGFLLEVSFPHFA